MKQLLNTTATDSIAASIIMCVWNNIELTMKCLESVINYTDLSYEVILIDNNSEEPMLQMVLEFLCKNRIPYTVIVNSENKGFIKGTNQGIRLARGEYIVLLNNDVEVTHGWLKKMINIFDKDYRIGIIGCLASPSDIGWQPVNNLKGRVSWLPDLPDWNGKTTDEYAKLIEERYSGRFQLVGMVAFFCTVIKQNVINEVGLLDEEYGIGLADDIDYCERARQKGYKVAIALDTYVYHRHRSSFEKLGIHYHKINEENLRRFEKKFKKYFRQH